jgi:uncharacterized protein (DUF58 family)
MTIFDEATLRKLEQLTLTADQVRVGVMKGDRRSKKRGSSIEFADYRNYTKGDDLRRLDWNVYARLERPFIKLLEEEEDLAVHLLIDTSSSMNWPDGRTDDTHKLTYALRLAAALGHIALSTGDMLTATLLHSQHERSWGPFRNQQNSLRLFQFLESATPGGITDINQSMRNYALYGRRPGILFLLSDMLSPNGYHEGVTALQARGYEVGLLHILSPDETDPPISGDLKLVDMETGADAELTLDATTLELYRQRLQAWQAEMAAFCANRRIHYIPIITNQPWEKLILQTLRRKEIVR